MLPPPGSCGGFGWESCVEKSRATLFTIFNLSVSDFGQEALRDYDEALRASLGGKEHKLRFPIPYYVCCVPGPPSIQSSASTLLESRDVSD